MCVLLLVACVCVCMLFFVLACVALCLFVVDFVCVSLLSWVRVVLVCWWLLFVCSVYFDGVVFCCPMLFLFSFFYRL